MTRSPASGFQLSEMLTVVVITGLMATLGVPALLQAIGGTRLRLGSAEIAAVFRTARSYAIRYDANVAVKFRVRSDASVTWSLYADGDGDGVLNVDIDSGVDPQVKAPTALLHLGRDIRFGFPPGPAPRDPGDPGRHLDRLGDPIRFNRSDLASFNPLGGATPGSAYLTDGRSRLAVVRVLGGSGRVRTLDYDVPSRTWR